MFEVPPAINMIQPTRVKESDVVIKEKITGKNPQDASYTAVFLKGWEADAYLMSSAKDSIYVANGVWEHPEYGLSGKKVLLQVRDSFLFLDPAKLTELELRKVILGSPFKKALLDHETQSKETAKLSVSSQAERYVVSIKGMRGGPVFHVSKKDLSVQHHMER